MTLPTPWGKLFVTSADSIRKTYDRLPDFQELRSRYDPSGKFGNEFLDRVPSVEP